MVILYSTDCPKCKILAQRLQKDKIDFDISRDVDELIEMGFQNAPILRVNDEFYVFEDAMKRLKKFEEGEGVFE